MFLCFLMLWDGVRITADQLDNNDTLNTTQSDSESTDQGEPVTNSTSGHVQTTEHSTVRNTQTEESSAMSTSTSEGKHSGVQLSLSYTPILQYFAIQRLIFSASPKNPSEGEKCCQNRGIPNECFGFCTPVSTAELLRNSLVHTCNEVFDSITECRNLGKGTFWPFYYSLYNH